MKAQSRTKRMSYFTTTCMFIASATLTATGIRMENTGLLITGIIAWFVSLFTLVVIISREVLEKKILIMRYSDSFKV